MSCVLLRSHHAPNSAHERKLKNQEGSKIYVRNRLLRRLLQRGFQKSTIPLAATVEFNTCKNSSQWRYGKNLCKNLDPTPILARKLRFLRAGYRERSSYSSTMDSDSQARGGRVGRSGGGSPLQKMMTTTTTTMTTTTTTMATV